MANILFISDINIDGKHTRKYVLWICALNPVRRKIFNIEFGCWSGFRTKLFIGMDLINRRVKWAHKKCATTSVFISSQDHIYKRHQFTIQNIPKGKMLFLGDFYITEFQNNQKNFNNCRHVLGVYSFLNFFQLSQCNSVPNYNSRYLDLVVSNIHY